MTTGEDDLRGSVRENWQRFLDTYEPLRPELYRYARHLTRSPWDAEDLAQESLARAFVLVAQMSAPPPNPRAWLLRVASNAWIDRVRRAKLELPPAEEPITSDPRAAREAAGTVLALLAPQERAAVVLKDAFDLSLEEVSGILGTTVGAVKAALHRGRTKLETPPAEIAPAAPRVLDAFCAAFQARDLEALAALLLASSTVEVVGATTEYGPEAAKRTVLFGMLFGVTHLVKLHPDALEEPVRIEPRFHRGEWLLLSWYAHRDGDAVRAITRLELDGDHVTHLRNYFYNVEFLEEVCRELGVPCRTNGSAYWRYGCETGR